MKATVVIPTLNAGPDFDALLGALARQEVSEPAEIIVLDSESTDGTPERAERQGARVRTIRRVDFNHGSTRNLGAEMAGGDFIAFLSQDAMPRDGRWLPELVDAFSDPRVAGSLSRVVARRDATPLVIRTVSSDLVSGIEPQRKAIDDPTSWRNLDAAERRALAHFNNVSSCVRRSALRQIGFPALSFGEDLAWGLRVLQAGWALAYQPHSVVEHSHPSALAADFRRHLDDARILRVLFDERPGVVALARGAALEVLRDLRALKVRSLRERLHYGLYSPWLRSAQALGRLVGAHLASTARERAVLDGR